MGYGGSFFQGVSAPATPAGLINGADNGLSVAPATTIVELGEDLAAPTGASKFIHNTLSNLFGFIWKILSNVTGSIMSVFINDTPMSFVIENDLLNSTVQSTEMQYKLRLKPGLAPPFNQTFEGFLGLRNTGPLFIRARDVEAVPTGNNAITFELQDTVSGLLEAARFTKTRNFLIGTSVDSGFRLQVNGGDSIFNNQLVLDSFGGATRLVSGLELMYQSNAGSQHLFSNQVAAGLTGFLVRISPNNAAAASNRFGLIVDAAAAVAPLEALVVNTLGNTILGGTADNGQKLQVNGGISTADATLLHGKVAFTNGAGASIGTLTNAPAAGNPTKWIPIDDNGTTRFIPSW